MRFRYVAQLQSTKASLKAVNVFREPPLEAPAIAADDLESSTSLEAGAFVEVEPSAEGARVVSKLADPGSAKARLYEVLRDRTMDPSHPPPAVEEVTHWTANPGIDDPSLHDLTAFPFVTVDGPKTRDLDQALFVATEGEHFKVYYAIADAAFYVRAGSALFDESLARGSSFYLPGLSVPMLPRPLSEGLISLNAAVDRRAMVFVMTIEPDGQCSNTEIVRARIRSRHKLSFDDVAAVLERRPEALRDPGLVASLRAFERVGQLRVERAARRNVVPHRNAEIRVKLGDEGFGFVAIERARNAVELYNEQLSLLCNIEGARILRDGSDGSAQPIYRTHASPDDQRLQEFERLVHGIADDRQLGSAWSWDRGRQSLAQYLGGLPQDAASEPLVRAIARQAIMVNVRSTFSVQAGPHFGIGADVYARFSAPMREVVGVFVHKEMWELLGAAKDRPAIDEPLRERVIEAANRSKQVQRELTHETNRLVLDQLFRPDLSRDREDRPVREGVVMGLRRGKIYVQLQEPPVDIKVYTKEIDPALQVDETGARLLRDGSVALRLGDTVRVRVRGRDDSRGRWLTELV